MATENDRPYRGRRLSWAEFYKLTGRKTPVAGNDNTKENKETKAK